MASSSSAPSALTPAAPLFPGMSPLASSALVCLFYAGTSVLISLVNKALLSSWHFNCYFFMLALQLAMTLAFCVVTRDRLGNPFRIPAFSSATYWLSVPVAAAYIANVCLGLVGLQMVNVPMFFCIRRTSTLFVLLYEFVSERKVAEPGIRGAVAVICCGAIVAGWESLGGEALGFLITVLNNVATAASTVMQKQFSLAAKLGANSGGGAAGGGPFGIMYYQALTALPLALLLAAVAGEGAELLAFPHLYSPSFWFALIAASVMGLLLSYSSLLCTTYNSPLTTSVTGNAKDVVLTIVGAVLFPGFRATLLSVGGLCLSFVGSGLYTAVSVRRLVSSPGGAASAPTTPAPPAPLQHISVASSDGRPGESEGALASGSSASVSAEDRRLL
jgi:solute carrier family 35 protein